LCGKDLLDAAREQMGCKGGGAGEAMVDTVVIPSASIRPAYGQTGRNGSSCAFNANDGVLLDDMTVAEMQSKLKTPVVSGGENLSQMLENIKMAAI
jgi:hypothetical protein